MQIKPGYILRSIDDQHVVVPTGEAAINFNGIITLNNTGKTLFQTLKTGATESKLIDALTSRYTVEEDEAKKDVAAFLKTLRAHDLLDE